MINLFQSTLTGAQEVGPNNSTATGLANFELNDAGDALGYGITIYGLDVGGLPGFTAQTPNTADDITGMHFHVGSKDVNGPVVLGVVNPFQDGDVNVKVNADGSTSITGQWDLKDAANQPLSNFVDNLKSTKTGADTNLYFNVHTQGFGEGEIRGQLVSTGQINVIKGTENNDTLEGTSGSDQIFGYQGDDLMSGSGGNDYFSAGRGNDSLGGGEGQDLLSAGKNNDLVIGGSGTDILQGDGGDDTLIGVDPIATNPGVGEVDSLVGGFGFDVFVLGDKDKSYYNDGIDSDPGRTDYAQIFEFNPAEDKIVIKGPLDNYVIGDAGDATLGTVIYQKTAGENELIAFLPGVNNLTSDLFTII